jgi:hypothetical protein
MPIDYWSNCRNLWCDYCLEPVGFLQFCRFVDAKIASTLPGHLAYVMSAAPRRGPPLALDMRPPADGRLFSVGLFYSVPLHDLAGIEKAVEMQRQALEECISLGGRPYLYGFWGGRSGVSSERLANLYGDGYHMLRRSRARVDPDGILNANALN